MGIPKGLIIEDKQKKQNLAIIGISVIENNKELTNEEIYKGKKYIFITFMEIKKYKVHFITHCINPDRSSPSEENDLEPTDWELLKEILSSVEKAPETEKANETRRGVNKELEKTFQSGR